MPVVTTLHTVLREPNDDQRAVMKQLDALSHRFIVMADRGRDFLETVYGVAPEKIRVIPEAPALEATGELPPPAGPYILAVGDLRPKKNLPRLIEAYRLMLEDRVELRDGPLRFTEDEDRTIIADDREVQPQCRVRQFKENPPGRAAGLGDRLHHRAIQGSANGSFSTPLEWGGKG